MSLIDEAKADERPRAVSTLDRLLALDDLNDVDRDEITELLKAPVVAHESAARVLTRHFGERIGRPISGQQVRAWRSANL